MERAHAQAKPIASAKVVAPLASAPPAKAPNVAPSARAEESAKAPANAKAPEAPKAGSKPESPKAAPKAAELGKASAKPVEPAAKSALVAPIGTTAPDDDAARVERSKQLFDAGAKAYEEHRYKDAIDSFRAANALTENPAFSFNIGIAYEDMGDPAMALRHYRDYVRQVPHAPDTDAVEDRIERIEDILAAKGIQQITVLSVPEGARLSIDGKPLGITPWTGELPPGHHEATLELAGYRTESRDFDLPTKRSIDVPITLRTAPVPDHKPVYLTPPPASPGVLSSIHVETWAVLGVGVVSLGTALGFELSRAELEAQARAEAVQVESARLLERARSREAWGRGFFMLGAGMTVTAVVLAVLNQDDPPTGIALGCDAQGCGAGYSGTF